jgi:hypothetical protein
MDVWTLATAGIMVLSSHGMSVQDVLLLDRHSTLTTHIIAAAMILSSRRQHVCMYVQDKLLYC